MQIFLDLDGVCTKFVTAAMRFHGLWTYDDSQYPVELGWDVVGAYEQLSGKTISANKFWNPFCRDFWATLPKTDLCDPLLQRLEANFGRDNICLLSAATLSPDCLAGKMEWVYENLPKWIHRQYIFTSQKHHCAKRDTLLIDDADKNVGKFKEYGGRSILVPRPWNTHHSLQGLPSILFRLLNVYTGPQ